MPVDPLVRLRELRGDYRRVEVFVSEWRELMRRALDDNHREEVAEAAGLSAAEVEEIAQLVVSRTRKYLVEVSKPAIHRH